MAALHKLLSQKQARMEEVIKNSAAVPALKQQYDKVLLDLQSERDKLQKERLNLLQVGAGRARRGCTAARLQSLDAGPQPPGCALALALTCPRPCCPRLAPQKLQHIQASSEEERRRLESSYKERLMAMDEQLKLVKRREVELLGTQRLKSKAEEVCRRLQEDIQRIKEQKVRARPPSVGCRCGPAGRLLRCRASASGMQPGALVQVGAGG